LSGDNLAHAAALLLGPLFRDWTRRVLAAQVPWLCKNSYIREMIFGTDIKTAGSASILISLCVVLTGIWRYCRLDAIPKGRGIKRITSAMASGSVVGATVGGLAVAYAPVGVLKVILGCVLIVSAAKTIRHQRQ
jgi:Sulfite exporter TauE/SafE